MALALQPSKLWPLLSKPQQRYLAALLSFTDSPTDAQLGAKLKRHRNGIARIEKQLIRSGLLVKATCGRPGGGRKADRRSIADVQNLSAVDVIASNLKHLNAHALFAEKANAQAILSQKGNAHMTLVQLPSSPLVQLVTNSPDKFAAIESTAIPSTPAMIFQNNSSSEQNQPNCCSQPPVLPCSYVQFGQCGGGAVGQIDQMCHPQLTADPIGSSTIQLATNDDATLVDDAEFNQLLEYYDGCEDERIIAFDPSINCTGAVTIDLGPGSAIAHIDSRVLTGCELDEIPTEQRTRHMGNLAAEYIHRWQPDLVLIEQPDHDAGYSYLPKLMGAYEAILDAVKASGIPYRLIGASTATAGRPNPKLDNMDLYRSAVGTLTSEHSADAFGLAWRFVMGASCK